ncbi:MAG: CsgG/HfaB family protein [Bacteroidetes bacterium]|nr:CsgG/HfaB family protein [Bacteroidota bacterium]
MMLKHFTVTSSALMIFTVMISSLFAQASLDQRITELTQQISKEMTDNNKKTIAVIEFSDLRGNVSDLGRYISEELITKLYLTKKFKVIERQLLNKIVAEQKLSLTGMIDPNSAKKLGNVLGVDAIVSGTITDLSHNLKVNARMLSTESGEIFAVASTEIFKDESVNKLLTSVSSANNEVNVTSNKLHPSNKDESTLHANSVESNGFVFTPQSCKILRDRLDCIILIENKGNAQKNLRIATVFDKPPSYIYDDLGNQYLARVEVGGVTIPFQQPFIPNIPVAVHFWSEIFNPDAKIITVVIYIEDFRKNITISKIPVTD